MVNKTFGLMPKNYLLVLLSFTIFSQDLSWTVHGNLQDLTSCRIMDDGVTDCSDNQLRSIPRNVPSNTRTLILSGNNLEVIEQNDFYVLLPELTELDLSNNQISWIDTSTFCQKLPKLKTLRLSRNKLTSLPDLSYCNELEDLHCSGNEITQANGNSLPATGNLQKLDLSKNKLTRFTSVLFPDNSAIQQLNLNSNDIEEIDGSFPLELVSSVQKLRLAKNKLTRIPTSLSKAGSLSNFTSLETLDLSRNLLTEIEHQYFSSLRNLKSIDLKRNRIQSLKDGSFYHCVALERLNLELNQLATITAGAFFSLTNLNELILTKNNISIIQKEAWLQTRSIKVLDLSYNSLERIPSGQFNDAVHLTVLNLSHNNILHLEEGAFMNLPRLTSLDLSGNKLTDSLHSSSSSVFQVLSQLKILDLSENRIHTLTDKLFLGLSQLNKLLLTGNPISTVENNTFIDLNKTTQLELKTDKLVCDCKISWLPQWLTRHSLTGGVQATCRLPQVLEGASIFDIDGSDFICSDERSPAPLITRHIRPTMALRGTNITLTCIATTSRTSSEVTVEWLKNNKILTSSPSQLIETEGSTSDGSASMYTTYLKLSNVDESSEGNYQCGFSNEFGSQYSELAKLSVVEFPTFTKTPSTVQVKTGHDIKLECEASGRPTPFISWFKDGKNFPAARDRRVGSNPNNPNEFIIKNAEWVDRGVYYCNATNDAGSNISNATVEIMAPPMFPVPISCTKTESGDYVLKCQAEGNPRTPIKWYKDGVLVQASDRYMFTVTYNSLFILAATPEDSGNYTCSASNMLGRVTQQCRININKAEDIKGDAVVKSSKEPVKKPAALDKSTLTGLIVIAVVCCIVGTSLVWVVIIYQTRKRRARSTSQETDETAVPFTGGPSRTGDSTQKIADYISDGSSNSKSDSFLEYRSSQDSPGILYKTGSKVPTLDSELASVLEPLNPNQESQDSLQTYQHYPYHHYTMGSANHPARRLPVSASDYSVTQMAHPFSTFQPNKNRVKHDPSLYQKQMDHRPSAKHSISAEQIPHIHNKRHPPPDLAHVLHQLRAPTQPPQAIVTPVHQHRLHSASSAYGMQYEEPAYMNLPKSAVTPSIPKNSVSEDTSDYMNIEPRDIHIYQNTSILNIKPSGNQLHHDNDAVDSEGQDSSHADSTTNSDSLESSADDVPGQQSSGPARLNKTNSNLSDPSNQSNNTGDSDRTREITDSSTSKSAAHRKYKSKSRREEMADSSFVEKKYGLLVDDLVSNQRCSDESRTSDASRLSHSVRSDL